MAFAPMEKPFNGEYLSNKVFQDMFGIVLTYKLWANMGCKRSYLKLDFNKKGSGAILEARPKWLSLLRRSL